MDRHGYRTERCQGTDGAARAAATEFGMTLMGELQKAIAAGGPVNAIGVCNM